MPRGDKSKYTNKQKRQAEHIEESYKEQGASEEKAERIAWSTVNKQDGGGKKSGAGRAKKKGPKNSRRKTGPQKTRSASKRKPAGTSKKTSRKSPRRARSSR
ncbi:MAG: plasmid stabilization protein [Anaerolineales bacterium]